MKGKDCLIVFWFGCLVVLVVIILMFVGVVIVFQSEDEFDVVKIVFGRWLFEDLNFINQVVDYGVSCVGCYVMGSSVQGCIECVWSDYMVMSLIVKKVMMLCNMLSFLGSVFQFYFGWDGVY